MNDDASKLRIARVALEAIERMSGPTTAGRSRAIAREALRRMGAAGLHLVPRSVDGAPRVGDDGDGDGGAGA
jgi:hypothetical protein